MHFLLLVCFPLLTNLHAFLESSDLYHIPQLFFLAPKDVTIPEIPAASVIVTLATGQSWWCRRPGQVVREGENKSVLLGGGVSTKNPMLNSL